MFHSVSARVSKTKSAITKKSQGWKKYFISPLLKKWSHGHGQNPEIYLQKQKREREREKQQKAENEEKNEDNKHDR